MADIANPVNMLPSNKHVEINLPSNLVFYAQIERCFIRSFNIADLNVLVKAKNVSNWGLMAEVICKTTNIPSSIMTHDDFIYICHWHRSNSFPRKPRLVSWTCNAPNHVALANRPDNLPDQTAEEIAEIHEAKATLENSYSLSRHEVDADFITPERFKALVEFMDPENKNRATNLTFHPATVASLAERQDMNQLAIQKTKIDGFQVSEENLPLLLETLDSLEEDPLYVDIASYLSPLHGATLMDRVVFLKSQESDLDSGVLDDLDTYAQLASHAPVENITLKCRGCGEASDHSIEFDLFDFFPGV